MEPASNAALALCDEGTLDDRLRGAFLGIHTIKPEAAPEHIRTEIEWILEQLKQRDRLSQGEKKNLAARIVETYGALKAFVGEF